MPFFDFCIVKIYEIYEPNNSIGGHNDAYFSLSLNNFSALNSNQLFGNSVWW